MLSVPKCPKCSLYGSRVAQAAFDYIDRRLQDAGLEPTEDLDTTAVAAYGCVICPRCRAARALQTGHLGWLDLASLDGDLQRVIAAWGGLPSAIREVLLALVGLLEHPRSDGAL